MKNLVFIMFITMAMVACKSNSTSKITSDNDTVLVDSIDTLTNDTLL